MPSIDSKNKSVCITVFREMISVGLDSLAAAATAGAHERASRVGVASMIRLAARRAPRLLVFPLRTPQRRAALFPSRHCVRRGASDEPRRDARSDQRRSAPRRSTPLHSDFSAPSLARASCESRQHCRVGGRERLMCV